ncbi:MAG TPA: hypothetical protein VK631_00140 [Solirubrobacteraceae bacterium]|nr:hypothetical protein [Solirubrobacteraceae bacterium]
MSMDEARAQARREADLRGKRLAIRTIHKACQDKLHHSELPDGTHCPQCSLDRDDYDRFIVGDEGEAMSNDERAERILRNLKWASRVRVHRAIVAAYEVVENKEAKEALRASALYGPHDEPVMRSAVREARKALGS